MTEQFQNCSSKEKWLKIIVRTPLHVRKNFGGRMSKNWQNQEFGEGRKQIFPKKYCEVVFKQQFGPCMNIMMMVSPCCCFLTFGGQSDGRKGGV